MILYIYTNNCFISIHTYTNNITSIDIKHEYSIYY